jgi:hypothetical protein
MEQREMPQPSHGRRKRSAWKVALYSGGAIAISLAYSLRMENGRRKVQNDMVDKKGNRDMKLPLYAVIAVIAVLAAQGSVAQDHGFGLGLIIGEPTGISAKLWTSSANAFDFGLGWSIGGDRNGKDKVYYERGSRVHVHMDYLWHAFNAIQSSERFPLFYGIGGRINTGGGYDASVAVRGVFGIAWLPHNTPIDVFLEIVPLLQLTPSTGFGIDAGIGARYYF